MKILKILQATKATECGIPGVFLFFVLQTPPVVFGGIPSDVQFHVSFPFDNVHCGTVWDCVK